MGRCGSHHPHQCLDVVVERQAADQGCRHCWSASRCVVRPDGGGPGRNSAVHRFAAAHPAHRPWGAQAVLRRPQGRGPASRRHHRRRPGRQPPALGIQQCRGKGDGQCRGTSNCRTQQDDRSRTHPTEFSTTFRQSGFHGTVGHLGTPGPGRHHQRSLGRRHQRRHRQTSSDPHQGLRRLLLETHVRAGGQRGARRTAAHQGLRSQGTCRPVRNRLGVARGMVGGRSGIPHQWRLRHGIHAVQLPGFGGGLPVGPRLPQGRLTGSL